MVKAVKAVFLDRDGVIVRGKIIKKKLYAPKSLKSFFFYPKVVENLFFLKTLGFKLFIITNQPDLANNKISLETLNQMNEILKKKLPISQIYMCTHSQKANCICRKPKTYLIKKAAKLAKGSAVPHTNKVGKITRAQAEEIATTKMPDLTASDMDAAVRTIAGSARSMGIDVEGVK